MASKNVRKPTISSTAAKINDCTCPLLLPCATKHKKRHDHGAGEQRNRLTVRKKRSG